jgi:VCBS repeat protein
MARHVPVVGCVWVLSLIFLRPLFAQAAVPVISGLQQDPSSLGTVEGPVAICAFHLSESGVVIGHAGGTKTIGVTAYSDDPACTWTAVDHTGFITVTTCRPNVCSTDTGDGAVWMIITANDSPAPRSGFVTIAGQQVPVMQAGQSPRRVSLDVNRDGRLDLLWQHELDGRLAAWIMDGAREIAGVPLTPVPDTTWKVVGTGDLDGDGWSDIVWQDVVDGRVAAWLMTGTFVKEASLLSIPQVADPRWRIGTVGDFNGDGRADLFWHDQSFGSTAIWVMDGFQVLFATLTPFGSDWRLAGNGDFDGDGNLDLVWQRWSDGRIRVTLLNGAEFIQSVDINPPTIADSNWKIRAVGDLNGDGKPDLIWQHETSGALGVWFMNGLSQISGTLLAPYDAVSDLQWHIVGPK